MKKYEIKTFSNCEEVTATISAKDYKQAIDIAYAANRLAIEDADTQEDGCLFMYHKTKEDRLRACDIIVVECDLQ